MIYFILTEQTNVDHMAQMEPASELSGGKVASSSRGMDTSIILPNNGLRNTAAPNPKGKRCLYLEPAPGTPEVHITRPRSMRQNRGSCKALPQIDRIYSNDASMISRRQSRLLSCRSNPSGKLGNRHFDNPVLSSTENPKPRSSRGSDIYRILSNGLFPDDESNHNTPGPSIPQGETDVKQGKAKGLLHGAKTRLSRFCRCLIPCCTSVTTD